MNKAFVREPDTTETFCPKCGAAGVPVPWVTVEHHVPVEKRRGLTASSLFCMTPSCEVGYFDAMESTHVNPLEDRIYETGPLVQSYPPEGSSHHTFTWFVRKQRGTYSLFRVELLKQADEKEPLDYIYEWGPTCDSVVTPSKPPRLK